MTNPELADDPRLAVVADVLDELRPVFRRRSDEEMARSILDALDEVEILDVSPTPPSLNLGRLTTKRPPKSLPDLTRPVSGKVGRHHAETAQRSAELMRHKIGGQKSQVVSGLMSAGRQGMTAAETAEILERSRNQTAARLLELHEEGWVTFAVDGDGEIIERPTDDQGNSGRVHVLTEAAWAILRVGPSEPE